MQNTALIVHDLKSFLILLYNVPITPLRSNKMIWYVRDKSYARIIQSSDKMQNRFEKTKNEKWSSQNLPIQWQQSTDRPNGVVHAAFSLVNVSGH